MRCNMQWFAASYCSPPCIQEWMYTPVIFADHHSLDLQRGCEQINKRGW